MLGALLERNDVDEVCELRSSFGFMAYHGGTLERATDVVAAEAAARSGASYYGVVQHHPDPLHIPSTEIHPDHSAALAEFLDHVDVVITVHGYGREHLMATVLVGGRNRLLAAHVVGHIAPPLADYVFHANLERIPDGLAGQHLDNPVNRPPQQGVQLELPPKLRWHHEQWGWSDQGNIGRAPQLDVLIESLATAATTWPSTAALSASPRSA